jgi:hypothetical protein
LWSFFAGLLGALFPPLAPRARHSGSRAPSSFVRGLFLAGGLALIVATAAVAFGHFVHPRSAPEASSPETSLSGPLTWSNDEELDTQVAAALRLDPGAEVREWTAIVLHHSASVGGSAKSFNEYHVAINKWNSLGYDFVIGNGNGAPDGSIEAGPRWRRQEVGAHAHSPEFNQHGIGICLVGDFEKDPPTPAQLRAARALVKTLCRSYNIPAGRIYGHKDVREGGGTACPGKLFPLEQLKDGVPD